MMVRTLTVCCWSARFSLPCFQVRYVVVDLPKDAARAPLVVQVTNGKTYEIAHMLEWNSVPFVFVSASPQNQLPSDLQTVPFVSKPFSSAQIERVLQALP